MRAYILLAASFACIVVLVVVRIAFSQDGEVPPVPAPVPVPPCSNLGGTCPGHTCLGINCSGGTVMGGCPRPRRCTDPPAWCSPNAGTCPCPDHCIEGWCNSTRACNCPWNESCYITRPFYNCTYCVFDNNPGYCDGGETVPCPN
jgi:hypothetical protein